MNKNSLLEIRKNKKIVFVAVDLQARLLTKMFQESLVVKNSNILIAASKILDIPLIITEQYPKGLGNTDSRIEGLDNFSVIEKTEFSVFGNGRFCDEIKKYADCEVIVFFGIETHVCMYQSVLDSLSGAYGKKYKTYLVEDACSSRTVENHNTAIQQMATVGANIESTEMILFQLLGKAGGDEFKQISALVK